MKKHTWCAYFGLLIGSLLVPVTALAHPGHGPVTGFSHGFVHPFTGVDHILAMLAVGLWAVQLGKRAVWAVPAAFVALMLGGGALAMGGVALPFIQAGILTSILVLGMLIAGAFRFPTAISAVIVGVFALFHGYAHGSELPLAVGALSYSIGFALATASLHGLGLVAGLVLQRFKLEKLTRVLGGAIMVGGLVLAFA